MRNTRSLVLLLLLFCCPSLAAAAPPNSHLLVLPNPDSMIRIMAQKGTSVWSIWKNSKYYRTHYSWPQFCREFARLNRVHNTNKALSKLSIGQGYWLPAMLSIHHQPVSAVKADLKIQKMEKKIQNMSREIKTIKTDLMNTKEELLRTKDVLTSITVNAKNVPLGVITTTGRERVVTRPLVASYLAWTVSLVTIGVLSFCLVDEKKKRKKMLRVLLRELDQSDSVSTANEIPSCREILKPYDIEFIEFGIPVEMVLEESAPGYPNIIYLLKASEEICGGKTIVYVQMPCTVARKTQVVSRTNVAHHLRHCNSCREKLKLSTHMELVFDNTK